MQPIKALSVAAINELAEQLPHQRLHFLLFLAWDAPDIAEEELISLFRPLVDRGLVYFCAWGANCEKVHDAVDHADRERLHQPDDFDRIIMTTWHAKESLAIALWFFKVCAVPVEAYDPANCDRFAVAVGNPDWAAELEREVLAIPHDADDEVQLGLDDEDD